MWRTEAVKRGLHIVSVPSSRNHHEMICWIQNEGYMYHRDAKLIFESTAKSYHYAFTCEVLAAAFKVRWG